tara:strand:+ start:158 stop:514 length:357 start_codon:yes stop_codon:yes gene_type:complete
MDPITGFIIFMRGQCTIISTNILVANPKIIIIRIQEEMGATMVLEMIGMIPGGQLSQRHPRVELIQKIGLIGLIWLTISSCIFIAAMIGIGLLLIIGWLPDPNILAEEDGGFIPGIVT